MTAEFLGARLKLAHLPGAHATFLKALRSGLGLRGGTLIVSSTVR